jgi:hypothetical protein
MVNQIFWMIERTSESGPEWMAGPSRYFYGAHNWTRFAHGAVKYGSRENANEALGRLVDPRDAGGFVTEHLSMTDARNAAQDCALECRMEADECRRLATLSGADPERASYLLRSARAWDRAGAAAVCE